jgi:indole-3-glycerol phosphate synthase
MLSRIFESKRKEVAASKTVTSLEDVKLRAADQPKPRGFLRAIQRAEPLALIAEVKKGSPSRGIIREDFDAEEIACAYEAAGAHVLSVLTDRTFFYGSPENLKLARKVCTLPALRKDFIDDPYQVYESRAWGADAILLIVAALEDNQLAHLQSLAHELEMDVLVEVHTLHEADRALAAKSPLIGVNNRDLSDFRTDLTYSETLLPHVARHATTVSESGLSTSADIDKVRSWGANAVLIGTTFCEARDIGRAVREVMGWSGL